MQADEIIQQKEWNELSPAEMQAVQELAENEQEYNLLKKMMQVSGEEVSEAPIISSSVKENLAEMVREQKPSSKRYWYLAAAAVAALIFAGIVIFPKKTMNDGIATNDPKPDDTVAIVKKDQSTLPEKTDTAIVPAPVIKDNIAQQQQAPVKPAVPAPQLPVVPDNSNKSYASADVRVSDNAALLNLVTEIY
jgi:hypothetical protein